MILLAGRGVQFAEGRSVSADMCTCSPSSSQYALVLLEADGIGSSGNL